MTPYLLFVKTKERREDPDRESAVRARRKTTASLIESKKHAGLQNHKNALSSALQLVDFCDLTKRILIKRNNLARPDRRVACMG